MAAANETRREWVRALLLRKTAPNGALQSAVETLTTDARSVSRWLWGQFNAARNGSSAERLEAFIVGMYCEGRSLREVAELVDRSQTAVRRALDNNQVPRRPSGAAPID